MKIEEIIERSLRELEDQEKEWLELRKISDDIVRKCGKIAQKIHVGNLKEAKEELEKIDISKIANTNEGLTAQQEYVETYLLLKVLMKEGIPSPEDIGVNADVYLLGLADLIGELRREITSNLLKDDYDRALELFNLMENIYNSLLPVRLPNAILPGFRRKMDVARGLVEQSRRDILSYKLKG